MIWLVATGLDATLWGDMVVPDRHARAIRLRLVWREKADVREPLVFCLGRSTPL